MRSRLIFLITAICLLSSCEKDEKALVLPPPTGAKHASVNMGTNYDKQVFFDFETDSIVYTSDLMSWDLAFEAAPGGRHIFMNGGKKVFVYNTDSDDMQIKSLPASLESDNRNWQFDAPCGLPDSTGIGEWYLPDGSTKRDIYIVETEDGVYQKMRILAVSSNSYTIEWAPLESAATPATVQLPKDPAYNFVYFSFTGGIVKPVPPKAAWDLVFTFYRHVFHIPGYENYPYGVVGALLNPYSTRASADSTTPFAQITLQSATALPASNHRDIIGYDWKTIDFNNASSRYVVNRAKNYILHTRKDQMYKMHFLDFYNSGLKGNPLFEYERLQ